MFTVGDIVYTEPHVFDNFVSEFSRMIGRIVDDYPIMEGAWYLVQYGPEMNNMQCDQRSEHLRLATTEEKATWNEPVVADQYAD